MDKRLRVILADVFRLPEAEIDPLLTKEEVGSWDSLKQMDLVTSLEREYEIVLEVFDIVKMTTVAGIIEVLREKGVTFEG